MEAKLPEEIFSDRTINSARSKPVTDEHPNEPVTLENYQTYAKGMSHTDARVEDLKLYVSLTITKGDGKSDDYINAFFDATVEQVQSAGFSSTGANSAYTGDTVADKDLNEMKNKRLNMCS